MTDETTVFQFTGTVTRSHSVRAEAFTALLTHFNPLFVIYVQVEEADEGLSFKAGELKAFAIHSLVQVLMIDDFVGQRFRFQLTCRIRDGKRTWSFDSYATHLPA